MAHEGGETIKAYYNVGTYATPSFATAMEGEISGGLTFTMTPRETTDKGDANWATFIAGIRNWTIECSGHIDNSNTAFDKVMDDALTSTQVLTKIEFKTIDSNKYSGDIWQTTIGLNGSHDGVQDFNFSFQGTGVLSQAAA